MFAWQHRYAAFSVSENEAGHHRKRSFEDEFVALLKKSGVSYDRKFVFG